MMANKLNSPGGMQQVIEAIKVAEAGAPFDAERLFQDFQTRVAQEKAAPAKRPWALSWVLPVASLALVLIVSSLYFWVGTSSPDVRTIAGNTRVEELKVNTRYQFGVSAQIATVDNNNLFVAKGSSLELLKKDGKGSRWELKEGFLSIKNDSDYDNVVEVGELEFRELGTEYEIKKENGKVELNVFDGTVRVLSSNLDRVVKKNHTWKYDLNTTRDILKLIEEMEPEPVMSELIGSFDFYFISDNYLHGLKGRSYFRHRLRDLTWVETWRLELPSQVLFITGDDERLAVATLSEYLYFFRPDGKRHSVRTGHLSSKNLFLFPKRIWVLNAKGELFGFNNDYKQVHYQKILEASLWAGVKTGRNTLLLPDTGNVLWHVDGENGKVLGQYPQEQSIEGDLKREGEQVLLPGKQGKIFPFGLSQIFPKP